MGGNADVAMTLWKGQSKRGHALVGFHAAAASPAPPMKKLRAGSSHADPPLRIGQSASPAVQSGTHAAPTTAASGRARPNALAPPPRRPFPSPPDRPPSSATDAANTALLAAQATAATVAATQVLIAHIWLTCCCVSEYDSCLQVYSHLTRSSMSRQRPDSVQTASRQCPDSVQTAKSERLDSYSDSTST